MGAIIAAIIAAAGGIIAGTLANKQTEEAQKEARVLSERARTDSLMMNDENKKLNQEQLKLQKQQVAFNRDAELYGRKERATERGMVARENSFAKSLSLLNSNEMARNAFLNNWTRRTV